MKPPIIITAGGHVNILCVLKFINFLKTFGKLLLTQDCQGEREHLKTYMF